MNNRIRLFATNIIIFFLILYYNNEYGVHYIKGYVISIVECILVFSVSCAILIYKEKLFDKLINISIIFVLFGLFRIIDENSVDSLGRIAGVFPKRLYFLCAVITSLIYIASEIDSIVILNRFKSVLMKKQVRAITLMILSVFTIVYYAWQGWMVNQLDSYNGNAFWTSVYQICHGIPYDEAHVSYYGHYAIIMAPFFKILGISMLSISVLYCIEFAICALAGIYFISTLARSFYVRLVSYIIFLQFVLWMPMFAFVYAQGMPHRFLFTNLIIVAILAMKKSQNKSLWNIIITILCIASIIWNNDTGIVISVSLAMYFALSKLLTNEEPKKKLLSFPIIIGYPFITIGLAYSIVNIINITILNGKWMSIKSFFTPYFDHEYMTGALQYPLNWKVTIWMIWMVILLGSFFYSIYRSLLFMKKANDSYISSNTIDDILLEFYASLNGIICLTYFFNRPAIGNAFTMSFFQLFICIIILLGRINKNKLIENRYFKIFVNSFVVLLIITGIYLMPKKIQENKKVKQEKDYIEYTKKIDAEVDSKKYLYIGTDDWILASYDNRILLTYCPVINATGGSVEAIRQTMIDSKYKIVCVSDYNLGGMVGPDFLSKNFSVVNRNIEKNGLNLVLQIYTPKK